MTSRAVLYARVSGDDRGNQGRNLSGQLDMCREYASEHGWHIVAELAEDERGASGASWSNPQLNHALEMARDGEYDVLVVRELDRLARGLAKQLVLEEEFRRHGVELTYVLGDYANTPEGNLMKNVRAVVAEYERLKIIERSARGRRLKAAAGKWPADGHAGYGYRKVGKGKDAVLAIDEVEAAIVRRIFDMYIGRDGRPVPLQTIASTLTDECVPPPNRGYGAAHPGKGWYRGTIRNLLASRRYIGEFVYGDITVELPEMAIIDDEVFAAAEQRRTKSSAAVVKQRKYDFLLSGHIACSCGGSMNGKPMQQGKYLYYGCTRNTNSKHLNKCEERHLRADVADSLVWAWLQTVLCDEERLKQGLDQLVSQRGADNEPKQERLTIIKDLIRDSERKIKRLTSAFANEQDDVLAAAYQTELKAGRQRTRGTSDRAASTAILSVAGNNIPRRHPVCSELARHIRTNLMHRHSTRNEPF